MGAARDPCRVTADALTVLEGRNDVFEAVFRYALDFCLQRMQRNNSSIKTADVNAPKAARVGLSKEW